MDTEEMYIPDDVREVLGDDKTGRIAFVSAVRAKLDMTSSRRLEIAPGAHDMYNTRLEALQAVLHKAYPEQSSTWWRGFIEVAADVNRRQEQARS